MSQEKSQSARKTVGKWAVAVEEYKFLIAADLPVSRYVSFQ